MNYFGAFVTAPAGATRPAGNALARLRLQQSGLTGHYREMGYPFDTAMWDGGVGYVKRVSGIYNDGEVVASAEDSWWPYEQSAYLLDGILKLGILLDDPKLKDTFERNLRFFVNHPAPDGRLGSCYPCDLNWPVAVFFRAVEAWCEYQHDDAVKAALIRHYQALPVETLVRGLRHICNLEGTVKAYEWSGDETLLEKAETAYQLHNEFIQTHPEHEKELSFDRLGDNPPYLIHGVTFSEEVKLPVLLYLYTGKKEYLDRAESGLANALRRHEQLPGLPSSNEDLAGRDPLQGYETCVINDFAWALRFFFAATGKAEYLDRIEKIVLNALGGSVTADFSALIYLAAPNQLIAAPESQHSFYYRGSTNMRQYRANHAAQCCPGNVHHIYPNYVMNQFFTTVDGAPLAALFVPGVFTGEFQGETYTIEEVTDYPHSELIRFRFQSAPRAKMPFAFRIPAWSQNASVQCNGKALNISLVPGAIARIERIWQAGDEVELTLPMLPVMKSERHWRWFEAGPLLFSLPVAYHTEWEADSRYAPRAFYPKSDWNYAPMDAPEMRLVRESGSTRLRIQATRVSGFDELEAGRYTPRIPLYCRRIGEPETLTLVPYGETQLRLTAFPDAARREVLPVYQALVSGHYPYDWRKPLAEQVFTPELIPFAELRPQLHEIFVNSDGYYDLLRDEGKAENTLCYVALRIYAKHSGEAVFSVGASTAAEYFLNGKKVFSGEVGFDAEFMAGLWFRAPVNAGYNVLLIKVGKGFGYEQYRNAWGVRADVFMEKTVER